MYAQLLLLQISLTIFRRHSNEEDFPDSDNFLPERFLDAERLKKFPGQFGHANFGWGRR